MTRTSLDVPKHLTPFQRELYLLEHDEKIHDELTLGKRAGLYQIGREIGTGNFSKVKLAAHSLVQERVAVKIVDKLSLDKKTQKMLFREMENMAVLHHPNVIRLFEVVEDDARMHIFLEYAPGGELYHKISSQGKLEENFAQRIFSQIVAAVDHIHSKRLVHRDIKAENVFFFSSDVIKLGDFGFSTVSEPNQGLTTFCGSPPYAAPELFSDPSYIGSYVDIWALGVLLYFITTASMPFTADSLPKLKQVIMSGHFTVMEFMSSTLKHLLAAILKVKPVSRMRIDKIMTHDWLSDQSYCSVYPESMSNLPRLEKRSADLTSQATSTLSLRTLTDDKQKVIAFMQKEIGIPDSSFKTTSSSGNIKPDESVLGIYRILMHRVQAGKGMDGTSMEKQQSLMTDSGVSLRDEVSSDLTSKDRHASSGQSSMTAEDSRNRSKQSNGTSSRTNANSKTCAIL